MKKLFILSIVIVFITSCKKEKHSEKINTISDQKENGFLITCTFENFFTKKVYLNKISENSLYPIDSFEVSQNKFILNGIVDYPERFALTYESYSATTVFIVENNAYEIYINGSNLNDPIIIGSNINTTLDKYKANSKAIFKKIDDLFPKFQKARLENNAEKLNEIGYTMKSIENEFTKFTYNYIIQNKNSFIAAMLLRDQLKSSKIDSIKIIKTYKLLSPEVKKCPDAKIIATYFNLH